MASSKEYVDFIMGQLANLDDVRYRAMMGEYVIYYQDKVIGGIYDDRFLIKNVEAAKKVIEIPVYEIPYTGAKEMILVENVDNHRFLEELFITVYPELPLPKPKKKSIK